jgi:AmiR/NasT family two-component response regulator
MRILIADDEALTRMGLRAMLREMGHTVVGAAAEGVTALRLACETRPDLAVLDIKMPGMDGLAVAQAIAEQCPIAVVMLTAYSERELVQRAAATETVQAYLVKPIREADLGPALELATARFAEWRILRQEAASRQEALAVRDIMARAKGVLMERDGLGERDAFLEIQHRARRERRTMRQIAEELLGSLGEEGSRPQRG